MSIAHLLEDYGVSQSLTATIALSEVSVEEIKLEAFENGYKAGWEDSVRAQSAEQESVSTDFARNLQDLSFTYHEAQTQVLTAMRPLLEQVIATVLPELAQQTLGLRIMEELGEIAKTQANQEVEVVVAPANAAAIKALLQKNAGLKIKIVEEPTMGEGQVFLRFAKSEIEIDLDAVLTGIRQAVDGFFHESKKDVVNA
jgi:flagellar assembly protein FliH